jgi:predicted Zn-ribbon and HTH transcriptional regulator
MFRKNLVPMLLGKELTLAQIARSVGQTVAETETDVRHFLKSLRHGEYEAVISPAECRKCGFEFGPEKLRKPGKCPECRSTWIGEAFISLRRKA